MTTREAAALLAYAETGSVRGAAIKMDVAEQTVKNHLLNLRERIGASTTLQAYHRLVGGVRLSTTITSKIETEDS